MDKTALLVSYHGSRARVRDDSGNEDQVQVRQSARDLVAGDRVILQGDNLEQPALLVAREERTTEIFRTDKRGGKKLIAANLDVLVVVVAPEPEPHLGLVDRYLAASEIAGISAAIVINKSDLGSHPVLDEIRRIYPKLGYPVFTLSTVSTTGLTTLAKWIEGKRLAFLGQSGAGKSSLVNRILEDSVALVGELSSKRSKGRHTTTASYIYPTSKDGWIMDSPGIREFVNSRWISSEIQRGFPEIQMLSQQCKFRNCAHGADRGCAVKMALEAAELEPSRFQGYIGLIADENR